MCSKRYSKTVDRPDVDEYMAFGKYEWNKERRLEAKAYKIIATTGQKIGDEPLEQFVERHKEMLEV